MDAAQEQIEAIYTLEQRGMLAELPDKLKEAVDLRMAHPEMTLSQLCTLCDPPVSKSALNHRLRKLLDWRNGEPLRAMGNGRGSGRMERKLNSIWKKQLLCCVAVFFAGLLAGYLLHNGVPVILGRSRAVRERSGRRAGPALPVLR